MAHESTIVFGLIEQALRQPAEQRRTFVEQACEGQPELLAEVLGMLDLVERDLSEAATVPSPIGGSPAVGAEPPGDDDATVVQSPFEEFELHARQCAEVRSEAEGGGYWIGPYKLVTLLGEGGFGAVFLAERRQPVRFRVALKVIRPGMDTRQVLARFEQERHVLAMMDHPGIARVVDAGATAAGRPFFAMEYVPGKPVTRYCDDRRLSIADRLGVFSMVCQAVQHAHDRGVIHRDLKPGNILVREIDNKPVVKVIDFGIAKATLHLQSAADVYTREGILIGTPEYMSPEQADKNAHDIDTRTDVFSLGVILYELLAGTLPIASNTLREAQIYEAYRIIREVERPRASTRLSELERLSPEEMEVCRSRARERGQASPDAAASEMLSKKRADAERVAKERQIGLEDLRRRLRHELDWILQKSLELPRNRRYDSPRALAEDIGRYLSGDTIIARPPTPGYTFRKFVKRNRIAVGTAAMVMSAIAIGAGVAVWKWREAVSERNATDEILRFVNTAVVAAANGDDPRGRIPIPKASVDEAVVAFASRFANKPAIRQRVRDTFAQAYLAAGVPASAVHLLADGAKSVSEAALTGDGAQAMGTALFRLHRGPEAVAVLEPAVARRAVEAGPGAVNDEQLAELRDSLAGALKWAKRFPEARSMYQIVKTMRQAATPVKVDALLRVDYDLVLLDTAEAKALAKDGKINAEELRSRLTDALARISAVAESASTRLGPETDLALMSRFERAAIRGDLQQFDEALDDARDTVPAMEELLGPRNWRTLEARSKFGSWLVRRTRAAEARTWLERAYAGYVAVNGAEDDSAITTGIWLGRALHDAGDTPAALVRLRSVIDAAEKAGADRAALGGRAERIADLCKEWGEAAEADTWRDRAARWKQTAKPAGP